MGNFKQVVILLFLLIVHSIGRAQMSGGNAFLVGDYVEVGIDGGGGFEGAAPALPGMHPRGGNLGLHGFVANPQQNSWATYDGDFFTPGTEENGWGLEFPTGINYHSNANYADDIPGSITSYTKEGDCITVVWDGDVQNVHVRIIYKLNVQDLFYTTEVQLTNNTGADLSDLYYYRNLDPDNNVSLSSDYSTTNTIVSQSGPGCIRAIVSAESTKPWDSYMALGAIGSNFRVSRGGFSNRDASDVWNGSGGLSGTPGSTSFADEAISLGYKVDNLPAGDMHSFVFVVVLNQTDVDIAISSLFNFVNDGVLINSSASASQCVASIDTIQVCGSSTTEISLVGDAIDDFSWNWSPSDHLLNTSGPTVEIVDGEDKTYTVTGSPVGGCFDVDLVKKVHIEFKDGPFIDWTDPGQICAADFDLSTLVYEDVNSIPGVVFTWHSAIPADENDMSNQLPSLTVGPDDDVFLMAASPTSDCIHIVEIDLSFGSLSIDNSWGNDPDCNTSNGEVGVSISGADPATLDIEWTNEAGDVVANTLIASNIPGGKYSLKIDSKGACGVIELEIELTSSDVDPPTVSLVDNISCFNACDGHAAASAGTGIAPLTFTWTSATSNHIGAAVNVLCAGDYLVRVTDANGCFAESDFEMTEPDEIEVSLVGSNVLCHGQCNGEIATVASGGVGILTYTWDAGPAVNTPSQTNLCSGTYNLDVTDVNGCLGEATIEITEPDLLTVNVTGTNVVCNSDCDGSLMSNVSGGTGDYNYIWDGGPSQNAANQNGVCAGTYNLDVTDENGCLAEGNIVITEPDALTLNVSGTNLNCYEVCEGTLTANASGGFGSLTYSWDRGPSTNTANQNNVCAGTYNLDVTDDNGCLIGGTVIVTQPAELTLDITGTDVICHNDCNASLSASANGGSGGYTYVWDAGTAVNSAIQNDVCPGDYNLTVTDGNGCLVNANHFIVNPPTLSSLIDDPADFCGGTCTGEANLNVYGGVEPHSFIWNSSNGSVHTTEDLVDACEGDYDVTITDANGCVINNSTVLEALSPSADFTGVNFFGCPPIIPTWTDLSTSSMGTIVEWDWNFGDGGTSSDQSPQYEFEVSGNYTVELAVTTDEGCVDKATMDVNVDVYDHPDIDFIWNPNEPDFFNSEVEFTDLSMNVASWEWHISDRAIETRQNPTHNFEDPGFYEVELFAVSSMGCKDSLTKIVEVKDVLTLFVPNAFTPNGDGLNDVFNLKGAGYEQFELFVFNRWGDVIFNTKNLEEKWDGSYQNNGNEAQVDVYVWKIIVKDFNGKRYERLGRVSLLR